MVDSIPGSVDVVIVGYGFAGATAALVVHDAGASVNPAGKDQASRRPVHRLRGRADGRRRRRSHPSRRPTSLRLPGISMPVHVRLGMGSSRQVVHSPTCIPSQEPWRKLTGASPPPHASRVSAGPFHLPATA